LVSPLNEKRKQKGFTSPRTKKFDFCQKSNFFAPEY